ncbi:MAG: hypothetical protein QXU40_02540 [Candidatus Pacearchaeota archaeon]
MFVLSSLWFWGVENKKKDLNKLADNYEFEKITEIINKGKEGKDIRFRYLNNLKYEIK